MKYCNSIKHCIKYTLKILIILNVTNFNHNSCKNISNHQHTKQYLRKIRENVWDCHNFQKKILFNSSLLLDLDSFLQQANTINCPKQWLASLVIKLYNFCRNGHFPVQRRFACFSSCSCSRAETLGKSGTALFVSYTLPLTKPTAEKH